VARQWQSQQRSGNLSTWHDNGDLDGHDTSGNRDLQTEGHSRRTAEVRSNTFKISYTACDPARLASDATAVDICGKCAQGYNNAASTFPLEHHGDMDATDSMGDSATTNRRSRSRLRRISELSTICQLSRTTLVSRSRSTPIGLYMHTIIIQRGGWCWVANLLHLCQCTSTTAAVHARSMEQGSTSPVSAGCPTLVKLGGNGAGSISLRWWGNG